MPTAMKRLKKVIYFKDFNQNAMMILMTNLQVKTSFQICSHPNHQQVLKNLPLAKSKLKKLMMKKMKKKLRRNKTYCIMQKRI